MRARQMRTARMEMRFWRSSAARIEQSAYGDFGERGTAAGGDWQKEGRQSSQWRRAAARNRRHAGGAAARNRAAPERRMGSAQEPRVVRNVGTRKSKLEIEGWRLLLQCMAIIVS